MGGATEVLKTKQKSVWRISRKKILIRQITRVVDLDRLAGDENFKISPIPLNRYLGARASGLCAIKATNRLSGNSLACDIAWLDQIDVWVSVGVRVRARVTFVWWPFAASSINKAEMSQGREIFQKTAPNVSSKRCVMVGMVRLRKQCSKHCQLILLNDIFGSNDGFTQNTFFIHK